jgi:SAM-dependent methyltransferase
MTQRIEPLLRRVRTSIERRSGVKLPFGDTADKILASLLNFPSDPDILRESAIYQDRWYYSVELLPGLVTKGIYPNTLPMLPRVLMRNCEVADSDCLDIGTMEGIVPALWARRGARRIVAADAVDHCGQKLAAVKHYYNVNFEVKRVGLMYELYKKFRGQSFDLINASGLLYHVFSPLLVLSGIRPMLKKNGLLILSTAVVFNDSMTMEFNSAGRLQEEVNTFWYPSVPLLDYLLRYLKLAPIDCLYLRFDDLEEVHTRLRFNQPSGYLSIVCRSTENALPDEDDQWMRRSIHGSWEYLELPQWEIANRQPLSTMRYTGNREQDFFRSEIGSMDLWAAVNGRPPYNISNSPSDTHTLMLSDES